MSADARLESLRSLLDLSPVAMLVTALADGRILAMNTQAERLFLTNESDALGRTTVELKFWHTPGMRERVLEQLRSGGFDQLIDIDVHRPDGTMRHALYSARILDDGILQPLLVSTVQDIHERKLAQDALRDSETRMQRIFENSYDGIWDWDLATGEVVFSPRYFRILGHEPGGFPATFEAWTGMLHPDDLPVARAALQRHFDDASVPYLVEFRMRHKDGSWVWIEARGSVVERDDGNRPLRMLGTHSDITRRKSAEEEQGKAQAASVRSEKRLEHVIQALTEGVMTLDGSGTVRKANYRAHEILKAPDGALVGINMLSGGWTFVHPSGGDVPPDMQPGWLTLQDGQPRRNVELGVNAPDGSIVWISVNCSILDSSDDGGTRGLLVSFSDITERRQRDEALRASEVNYRLLAENTSDIIMRVRDRRISYLSPSLTAVLGWDIQSLLGSDPLELVHPDDVGNIVQALAQLRGTGRPDRPIYRLRHREGHWIWMEASLFAVRDAAGDIVETVSSSRDISERKRMEEAMDRERTLVEAIFNSVPGIIFLYDAEGHLVRWNRKHELMTGYSSEELSGMTLLDWYKEDAKSQAAVLAGVNATIESGYGEAEAELQRKDGTRIPMFFSAAFLTIDGNPHFAGIGIDISERRKQEEEVRRNEAMYRLLAENSLDIVTRHDMEGRYLWASPSAKSLLGIDPEELVGRSGFDFIHPEDRAIVSASLERILKEPVTSSVVYRHLTGSGKWIWVESMSRALRDAATGSVVELQVSTRDITERKTAEDRYRSLFENLTTGFALHEIVLDESGKPVDYRFLEVNPAYEKLTSLSSEHVVGKLVTEALPGVEHDWIESFCKVAVDGEPLRYENYVASLDRWYETWAYRPAPGQFAVLVSDATERKKQEEALRQSEANYRLLAENSTDVISRISRDATIAYISPSILSERGWPPEHYIGCSAVMDIHPDDIPSLREAAALARSTGGSVRPIYRSLHRDGSWGWVEASLHPLYDADGNPDGMVASSRDVTARVMAEQALKEREERLRLVLDATSDGIFDWDLPTGSVHFSTAIYTMLGFEPGDFPGHIDSWRRYVHPDDMERTETLLRAHLADPEILYRTEYRMRTRDGDWKWVMARGKVVTRAADGTALRMVGTQSDITERKLTEKALAESEERFRFLAENSLDVVLRLDPQGIIRWASPSLGTVLDQDPVASIGLSSLANIHPDDQERIAQEIGTTLREPGPHKTIYRHITRQGRQLWVESIGQALRDPQTGAIESILVSTRDITERVEAEEQRRLSEARLREVADMSQDMLSRHDPRGVCLWASPACRHILGMEPDAVVGRWAFDFIVPEDHASVQASLEQLLVSGHSRLQYRILRTDGTVLWVETIWSLTRDAEGSPFEIHCSTRDIGERKRQNELLEETQRLARLGGWEYDVATDVTTWTPQLYRIHELDPDHSDVSKITMIHDYLDKPSLAALVEAHARLLSDGVPWELVLRGTTFKGNTLVMRCSCEGEWVDGKLARLRGTTLDITERVEAEEQRRLSEARLREVADMSQDMLSRHDPQGVYLWASPACRHILGTDPDTVVGRLAFDFIVPEDHPAIHASLEELILRGHSRLQYRILRTDGSILWVETIWSLTRDANGDPFEIHCSTRDISERRRQSELLEETQRLAHVGGWEFYFDTVTTVWTREMKRIFGLDPEDPPLQLETLKSLLEPQSLRLYEESFERLMQDGTPWDIPLRGRTVDGRQLITRLTCDSEMSPDGKFIAIRGSMQDITESELLRERLESASRLNQSILATTEALVVLLDPEGRIVRFNEACQRVSGWSESEMLGVSMVRTLVPEAEQDTVDDVLETLVAHCQPCQFENHWVARDERRFWISWVSSVILDESGKPLYVLCTGIDMTAHRATQQKLHETQERWRVLIETAPEAILILDVEESRFTQANPAAEVLFGRSESEIVTLGPLQLSPPTQIGGMSTVDAVEYHVRRALECSAVSFDWIHLRADGREILCQVNLSRIPSDGHTMLRASLLDITEKRKTESVMESLVQRTSSLFGQAFFDALVRDLAKLLEVRYAFVARVEPDGAHIHTVAFVADGNLALGMTYPIAGSPCEEVLSRGMQFHPSGVRDSYPGSLILDDLDAESYMAVPLYNVAHQPIGILAVVDSKPMLGGELARSILAIFAGRAQGEMERHEAELALRRLNSELEQRVRDRTSELVSMNRELESFSYSVSHDLRSPLRSINGFAQALHEDYAPSLDEEARGYLDRIRNASHRMSELIDDLLSLSQSSRKALRKSDVDVSAMALEILEMLQGSEPDRAVEYAVEPGLRAWADPVLLRAVMENLIGNSWKYTRRTEHPHIELRSEPTLPGRVGFALADNGAGFDMTFAQKLFGTFQRLHGPDEFEGNGIGLATVKRILERHGGTIRGQGEIGKGATFVFELPAFGG